MKRSFSISLIVFFLIAMSACAKGGSQRQEGEATGEPITAESSTPTPSDTVEPTNNPNVSPTPDPLAAYDAHDYGILRTFFELTDENGITNGEKCFTDYEPGDPTTWMGGSNNTDRCIIWSADGKVRGINLRNSGDEPIHLTGRL